MDAPQEEWIRRRGDQAERRDPAEAIARSSGTACRASSGDTLRLAAAAEEQLAAMSPMHRAAFNAFRTGRTVDQIAAEFAVSVERVRQAAGEAREALREGLAGAA